MSIRKATPQDADALVPLLEQLGYSSLDTTVIAEKITAYSQNNDCVFVYELEGQVVAFIALHVFEIFHSPGRVGRIAAFCVDEHHRSKGIGIEMLNASEQYFRAKGCRRVEVTSNNRRTQAHRFYLHRGYVEDSKKFVLYF